MRRWDLTRHPGKKQLAWRPKSRQLSWAGIWWRWSHSRELIPKKRECVSTFWLYNFDQSWIDWSPSPKVHQASSPRASSRWTKASSRGAAGCASKALSNAGRGAWHRGCLHHFVRCLSYKKNIKKNIKHIKIYQNHLKHLKTSVSRGFSNMADCRIPESWLNTFGWLETERKMAYQLGSSPVKPRPQRPANHEPHLFEKQHFSLPQQLI